MDYIKLFRNLKPLRKYAGKPLEKALLLLAVIELYESSTIEKNKIVFNEALFAAYRRFWERLLSNEFMLLSDVSLAFWGLHIDPFWHLVPIRGRAEIVEDMRSQISSPSSNFIKENIDYVELDEDLYFLLTLSSGRTSLKRALLETYFDLSGYEVERMCQVDTQENQHDFDDIAMMNSIESRNDGSTKNFADSSLEIECLNVDEEVWLTLCISYYTFLKKHPLLREVFNAAFGSPSDVYRYIYLQENKCFPPSFRSDMIAYMRDLQIALMRDDNSMLMIDAINARIKELEGSTTGPELPYEYYQEAADDGIPLEDYNISSINYTDEYHEDEVSLLLNEVNPEIDEDNGDQEAPFLYIPKRNIKKIESSATSSYDFLWTMAIIDLVRITNRTISHTFDNIACMMLANAWELLRNNTSAMDHELTIKGCINFLIEESRLEMEVPLSWDSTKEEVYYAIKDFPMYGEFEDTIDKLLEKSPMNVLKTWFPYFSDSNAIIESINFTQPCLYALHLRKIDPYIDVNKKWLKYLYYDHDDLIKYFTMRYYEFINQQS